MSTVIIESSSDKSPLAYRIGVEAAAATISALTVAPAISIVDKAIVSNASGLEKLVPSLMNGVKTLFLNPIYFFKQPSFLFIWGVYSGTYIVANSIEALCERSNRSSFYPKFVGSSAANVSLSVLKDKAFAKMFGTGEVKHMTYKSMGLFATRDSMTILASFSLPGIISEHMQKDMHMTKLKSDTLSQLITPVSMQIFSTPLHLLGLDIYNRSNATKEERKAFIQKEYLKTTMARMARIFPAFGVGGVVNKYIRKEGANSDFNDQWKVLIYDKDCRDIISPLLTIGALRQKGVTLHLEIDSNREAVPDAPAVYFVRPTEANVKRIAEDCAKQLYRTVYLNFVTRIDRTLMEKLAQDLVNSNSVSMVAKIYDQYLDMIALEPGLFTLNIKDSFMLYNESSLSETQIRGFMSRVASGLLSTVRVLGALPIIRCAPGGAAEMLARELNALLKENISSRGPAQALFEECLVNDRTRPLLLITDRVADLFPVLQHASTYQALINDLLDLKLNRVTIEVPEKASSVAAGGPAAKVPKKTYDLNTQADGFLNRYAGSPFPEAVDANEKELAEVSQREAAIRTRPDFAKLATDAAAVMTGGGLDATSMEGKGRDLSQAIESLPEILQKKMNLEAHTSVLQAVMRKIALREIPTYFEVEQGILTNGGKVADRTVIIALLKDGGKGLLEDKARLLLLVAVSGDTSMTSKASVEELDAAFTSGCESIVKNPPSKEAIEHALSAIQFMRRLQSLQSGGIRSTMSSMGGMKGSGSGAGLIGMGGGSGSNALLSSFLTSAHSRATSLMAKAASFFTKFTPYYVTRTVHNLAEGRSCPEDESFLYLDPRSRDNAPTTGLGPGSGHKFGDVIVFVLGGGNYSEFYNLQELLKDKAATGSTVRSITYGCTDMLSGDALLDQLKRLAKPTTATSTTTAAPASK